MDDMPTDPVLQRLIYAHPLIFRGQAPAVPSHLRPGWYELVHRLCRDIEHVLGAVGCAQLDVRQLKEKFGSLRMSKASLSF
jgi:hypothetical protein